MKQFVLYHTGLAITIDGNITKEIIKMLEGSRTENQAHVPRLEIIENIWDEKFTNNP